MSKINGPKAALSRRRVIKAAGALAAGLAAPSVLRVRAAYAAYPDRPVKIVVANTPGGPSDLVGRVVAAALEQSTGKTFIIENRGGAGGNIGMSYVAHAEPDGYTILLATNALSVNVGLYKKLPFDPQTDFVAIGELAGAPNIFVVRTEQPAKTMKEFIALARASPEKYNVSGSADRHHTAVAGLAAQIARGPAQAGGSRIQGRRRCVAGAVDQHRAIGLQFARTVIAANQGQHDSRFGDLRGIRWPDFPDIPTMQESGTRTLFSPPIWRCWHRRRRRRNSSNGWRARR